MRTRLATLAAALACLPALAGCGSSATDRPDTEARLVLDAPPSAVHAGIYLAEARGFTDAEGVDLRIEAPSGPRAGLALLDDNRTQFAVLDLHDLALARQDGKDYVAVMALTQEPRAAVIARAGITSARRLAGARVAVTGRRSDSAVLGAIARAGGAKAGAVATRTAGFRGGRELLAGKADAMTALGTGEATTLPAARKGLRSFGIEDAGAPRYPELVLVCRRELIQDTPATVQATVTALRRGAREVVLGPEEAVGVLTERADGLDRRVLQADLDALLPDLDAGGRGYGVLDVPTLERWARWEQEVGITKERPDVAKLADPSFATRGVISG